MIKPTQKTVDAAYEKLPYNDLLYGDMGRPLSKEELAKCIEAAYEGDKVISLNNYAIRKLFGPF